MHNHLIEEQLQKKIVIIDGAMGNMLQGEDLTADDFGGEELDGCNENLVLTRPDVLSKIHRQYLEAGADIICTNKFGGTPLVLNEYGLGAKAEEINKHAVKLAVEAAEEFSTSDWPRFVAGAIGPTTKTLSVTGGISFDELSENFYIQAKALIEGGAHLLLLETSQDMLNVKAATLGMNRAFNETNKKLPMLYWQTY
jgi:5-methyltetrahydrofolate--homocysteine methyltransferase